MLNLSSLTPDLDRIAIDPGSSFLNGGATSLFSGKGVTVGRVSNPFAQVTDNLNLPDATALASQVVSMIVSDVTTFAVSYLGEQIGDLLTPPSIADITAYGNSKIKDHLKSVSDIMKDLTSEAETNIDSKSEEENKKQLSDTKKSIFSKIADVRTKINNIVNNDCVKWAQSITSYINQGPKWVEAQAKMIDEQCCAEIEKQIAEQTQKLKKQKEDAIKTLGEKYAKQAAKIANEKLFDETYLKLKKVKQQVAKAKNEAISAAKKALMQLKAALGM